MAKVTLFRNVRRDGEAHTGVAFDEELVLEGWKNQAEEPDPVLDWFVEIEIEAPEAPVSPDQLRAWLLSREAAIDRALEKAEAELDVGVDGGVAPFRFRAPSGDLSPGHECMIEVRGAVSQRVRSTDVARYVQETRLTWRDDLSQMSAASLQTA